MSRARPIPKLESGVWVRPIHRGYRLGCCACGLVHRMDFRIAGRAVEFRAFLDPRATANARRVMRRKAQTKRT